MGVDPGACRSCSMTVGTIAARPARPHQATAAAAALYLVASCTVWWHAWSSGPGTTMTCACTDAGRTMWYLAWSASAILHGHDLWYSTLLFHPRGFNVLTDTSILALGAVMTPVTWVFGPVVSMNTISTLTPVLSGLSMFWLLRRWVRWTPAAFLGGLFFGFSPFVVVQLAYGWVNLAFVALLPAMVGCIDEILVRQRVRPAKVGIVLAALATAQFFVSSEMLLIAAVTGVVAAVALAAYWAVRDLPTMRRQLPYAWRAGAIAMATSGALLALPAWYFLAGPGHLHGALWSTSIPGDLGNVWGNFWSHTGHWGPVTSAQLARAAPTLGGYAGAPLPSPSFLGVGLIVIVGIGITWWRSDRRLWLFGTVALVAAVLSLRVGARRTGAWSLFVHLPVFDNVVQSRFAGAVDLCAAVMIGMIVDHCRWWPGSRPATPWGAVDRRGRFRAASAATRALLAGTLSIAAGVGALAPNIPLTMQAIVEPRWFATVGRHLPPHHVVMAYPYATADSQSSLVWQALDGLRFSMPGGGGPSGTAARNPSKGDAVLRAASLPFGPAPALSAGDLVAVRRAMAAWRVDIVVVPGDRHLHRFDRGRGPSFGVGFFTAVFGQPPRPQAGAWVWDPRPDAAPPSPVTSGAFGACTGGAPVQRPAAGLAVARCVLAASATGSAPDSRRGG